MNKLPDNKPSVSQKEKLQFFDSLFKSVAGLVGIVILLLGVVLLLVFQPEMSALMHTDSTPESSSSLAESPAELNVQLIDGKDVDTGLLAGDGLEIVKGNCTACHSSALILQNRFTREGWHDKIVWMQETQGLWDLGGNESIILDYLAANYGPTESRGRRLPLTGIDWYELKD